MSIRNLFNYINELLMDIDDTDYNISEISKTIPNRKLTQINNKNNGLITNYSIYKQTKYFGRILFLSDFESYDFGEVDSILEEYTDSILTNLPISVKVILDNNNNQILIKNKVVYSNCKLVNYKCDLIYRKFYQNNVTIYPSSIKQADKNKINQILTELIEKKKSNQKNLQTNIRVIEEIEIKELMDYYQIVKGYKILLGKRKIQRNHFIDFHKTITIIICYLNSCEIINNKNRNSADDILRNYFLVNIQWKLECRNLVFSLKSKLKFNHLMKPEIMFINNRNQIDFNRINEQNEIEINKYDNLMIPNFKKKTNRIVPDNLEYLKKTKPYEKETHKISNQSKLNELINEKMNDKNGNVPIINVSLLNHEISSQKIKSKINKSYNKFVKNISQSTSNLRKIPLDSIVNEKFELKNEIDIHNSPNRSSCYQESYEDTVKMRQIFRNPILQVVNGELKLFKFYYGKSIDYIYKSNPYNQWLLTGFPIGLCRGIKNDSKGFNYKFSVYVREDINCHNLFLAFNNIKLTNKTKSEFQQWCMENCQYNTIEIYEELLKISFNYKMVNQQSDKNHILKIIANKCKCYVTISDRFSHANFGLCRAIQFIGVEKNAVLTCIRYLIMEINEFD